MQRLRRRADFLAAATGPRAATAAFVLQAKNRSEDTRKDGATQRRGERTPDSATRVGFTVTRKIGNAVERNRIRRRLREVVRLSDAARLQAGHDYVLVGRRAALTLPFARIAQDFDGALRRLHAGR